MAGTNTANFGTRIDSGRNMFDQLMIAVVIQQVFDGKAPLIIRRAGQTWKADDIADGIHMFEIGLIMPIDRQLSPVVDLNPKGFQPHILRVSGTAVGPE